MIVLRALRSIAGRDFILAVLSALACFTLYLLTHCPTVFWYDSAEYATAAFTLGIPHPPGYPLYTIIGRLFVMLPLEPARAMNLMSAAFAALAVGLAYTLLRSLRTSRCAAAVGALALGASHLFWSQALIAEVYDPALAFLLAVLLLLAHGLRARRPRLLVVAAGLAGLGLGMHYFIATAGLGLVALVLGLGLEIPRPGDLRLLLSRQGLARRIGTAAACLGAALLGACIYLWLPLRASMNPSLNFENPSTGGRFLWFITGGNYKTWWLHDYDRLARAGQILGVFSETKLLAVGLLLAVIGAVALWRRQALWGLALLLIIGGNVLFFFRYRVHDVEVFFLPTVVTLALLVGLGADAMLRTIDGHLSSSRGQRISLLVHLVLFAFPLSLATANYHAVDLSGYTAAHAYGEALSAQLPPRAVIINLTTPPEWKNDAVFALYFQKVLGRRPDVQVRTRVSPASMVQLLVAGVPLYLYYPDPRVEALFVVRKEGVAYRVLRPRSQVEPPDRSCRRP